MAAVSEPSRGPFLATRLYFRRIFFPVAVFLAQADILCYEREGEIPM